MSLAPAGVTATAIATSTDMTTLRVRLLRSEATVPRYATDGSAGLDLAACIERAIVIAPGRYEKIPTGIAIELPPNTEGQVRPRSGLAARRGVTVLNAPGTIDEDFRGEVQVILINHGLEPFEIAPGDRIAQLVVTPVIRVGVQRVESLDGTQRGEGGFGSTGIGRAPGDASGQHPGASSPEHE